MLNPALLLTLESYGLTNDHLEQLVSVCVRGPGRAIWHVDREGFAKLEVTLFRSMRDSSGMREISQLLHKEH